MQGFHKEGIHPAEDYPPSEYKMDDEDLIPNLGELQWKAMSRPTLLFRKCLKTVGSRHCDMTHYEGIPNLGELRCKAMSRPTLLFRKCLKTVGSRHCDMTHYEGSCDVPGPNSMPATIKINTLQTMYEKYNFRSPSLPDCFGMKVKQKNIHLIQIKRNYRTSRYDTL